MAGTAHVPWRRAVQRPSGLQEPLRDHTCLCTLSDALAVANTIITVSLKSHDNHHDGPHHHDEMVMILLRMVKVAARLSSSPGKPLASTGPAREPQRLPRLADIQKILITVATGAEAS